MGVATAVNKGDLAGLGGGVAVGAVSRWIFLELFYGLGVLVLAPALLLYVLG